MQVIYDKELSAIAVAWQIEKAQSGVPEQFYGAKLKVMLVHDTAGRFPVGELDVTDGTITFVLPDGLPVGIYGLKAIWSKESGDMGEGHDKALPCREGRLAQHPNHHTCLTPGMHPKGVYNRYNVSEVSHVFTVTDVAEESTVGANGGTITIRSRVSTYGRDGLDAYERALMLDRTSDGETDWLSTLQVGKGSITWDMLSDEVKEIIIGGGSEDYKVNIKATPSIIPFTDQEVTIALVATSTKAADIAIYVDGEKETESEESTTKLEGELHIIPSQMSVNKMVANAIFNAEGVEKSTTTTIRLLSPLFYGWGTSWNERVLVPKSAMSPVGEYDIHIMENNSYVFFLIPEGMTINRALVGSVEMPLTDMGEIEYSGRNYEMYQSVFTYDRADITIQIE